MRSSAFGAVDVEVREFVEEVRHLAVQDISLMSGADPAFTSI